MFIPGFCRSFVYLFTPAFVPWSIHFFSFKTRFSVGFGLRRSQIGTNKIQKYTYTYLEWLWLGVQDKTHLFPMCRRVRRAGTKIHLINVNTHLFSKSLVSKWTETRSATGLSQRHKLVAIFAPISPFQNLVRCLHTTYSNGNRSFRPQSFECAPAKPS